MINIALIVEGYGDLAAVPALVVKSAMMFNINVVVSNPIRSGGVDKLRRAGELERFVTMAACRPDANLVLLVIDLDDDCAATMQKEFKQRCKDIEKRYCKPIEFCFIIKEFECWLLADLVNLREKCRDYNWLQDFRCERHYDIRGAKAMLGRAMRRHYKETVDQLKLAKALDLISLFSKDRSFRKFVKSVTQINYAILNQRIQTVQVTRSQGGLGVFK